MTSSSGSRRSRNARASGRAAASSCVSRPISLPSHQRAASGKESSRSVSPVGAQSTTITSQSPSSTWRLSRSRLNSSSPPGGTVSSSAAIRSTPRSTSTWPSQPCTADQWRSSSSCAETCCAQRLRPDLGRLAAHRQLEHVGERVRGIGGEHDRAQPCGGAAAGGGGGDRRLADAALARVEDRARGHRRPRSLLRGPLAALRLEHLDGPFDARGVARRGRSRRPAACTRRPCAGPSRRPSACRGRPRRRPPRAPVRPLGAVTRTVAREIFESEKRSVVVRAAARPRRAQLDLGRHRPGSS